MSHFTVLVVTDTPDEDALKKALQPFHEYECTGTKDEFVVFVDCHDEVTKEWQESTEDYWTKNGETYKTYDPMFYRDFTPEEVEKRGPLSMMGCGCGGGMSWDSRDWGDGKGYRAKAHMHDAEIEELGYIKKDIPVADGHTYDCIEEYAAEYHGYDTIKNGRIGRMTNPNAEWDWWQVGGRWSGKLLTLSGERVDHGFKRDMTFDTQRLEAEHAGATEWDKYNEVISGRELIPFETYLEKFKGQDEPHAKAREEYWAQQVLVDLKDSDLGDPFTQWTRYFVTRDAFVKDAGESSVATFAFLGTDGKWQERGDMGWFGMVSDENNDWGEGFMGLLNNVNPDQYIWVVDCHI